MIDQLPIEIIQVIIDQRSLTFSDLVRLSSTCTLLREFILKNKKVWKRHYMRMWSRVPNLPEIDDYYIEFTRCHNIIKTVNQVLIRTRKFTERTFKEIIKIIDSKRLNREYAIGFFVYTFRDKSYRYMIQKQTLYCLTHYALHRVMKDYFALNVRRQNFVVAITLFEQWLKPHHRSTVENVQKALDNIAEEVKKHLRLVKPKHPLFDVREEDLKKWRNRHLLKNQFSSRDCKIILEVLNKVMFEVLRFQACPNIFVINNLLISKVLETQIGSRLVLSIIYESVARRLGVNLSPYSPGCFYLLKFIEDDYPDRTVHILDIFSGGAMVAVDEETVMQSGLGMPVMRRSNTKDVIASVLPSLSTVLIIKGMSLQPHNLEEQLLYRAVISMDSFLRNCTATAQGAQYSYSLRNIIDAMFNDIFDNIRSSR